jgi:hypothetical protein
MAAMWPRWRGLSSSCWPGHESLGYELIAAQLDASSLAMRRAYTVILVTHDPEIAANAHRSIRMQDCRLLEPTLA